MLGGSAPVDALVGKGVVVVPRGDAVCLAIGEPAGEAVVVPLGDKPDLARVGKVHVAEPSLEQIDALLRFDDARINRRDGGVRRNVDRRVDSPGCKPRLAEADDVFASRRHAGAAFARLHDVFAAADDRIHVGVAARFGLHHGEDHIYPFLVEPNVVARDIDGLSPLLNFGGKFLVGGANLHNMVHNGDGYGHGDGGRRDENQKPNANDDGNRWLDNRPSFGRDSLKKGKRRKFKAPLAGGARFASGGNILKIAGSYAALFACELSAVD